MSTISIVGTGNMASTLAALAVAGGNTTAGEFGAVPAGDIVIVALGYAHVVPVITQYGEALAGKVIVDLSNPVNATGDGLAIPAGTSIAQNVAEVAPAGATVVKAFNTTFGAVLTKDHRMDVLIAGDDENAKAAVAEFVESLALRPLDVGGLNMAQYLEGTGLVMIGLAQHGVGNFDFALDVVVPS